MDRVRFITHQGKQILFIDVTNCAAEDVIELLTEVQRIVTAQPPKSVLTLSDLTGAQFSRATITRMKEVAVFDRPYVKRAAFVGALSLPKVFYEALKTLHEKGATLLTTNYDDLQKFCVCVASAGRIRTKSRSSSVGI